MRPTSDRVCACFQVRGQLSITLRPSQTAVFFFCYYLLKVCVLLLLLDSFNAELWNTYFAYDNVNQKWPGIMAGSLRLD